MRHRSFATDDLPADRGQAVTLEALLAALLLVGTLLVVVQTVAVTPSSASASNAHLENQHERVASGVLDAAAANGSISPTLRYWNESNGSFYDVHEKGYYANDGPPTALGRLLDRSLAAQGLAYNLDLEYVTRTGAVREQRVVYVGAPSPNAVTAARTVVLTDDDVLLAADGTPTNTTLAEAGRYFAPDAAPGPTYNVVRLEVEVWRR